MSISETVTKPKKKLFGVSHPIGKAVICIAFIAFTGGLGLIFLILAAFGDRALSKKKSGLMVILMVSILPSIVHAQSWAEQQQQYNERANLETQQFQQQQEAERIQQENEKALAGQRRELEQQQYELEKMKDEQTRQQQELEWKSRHY